MMRRSNFAPDLLAQAASLIRNARQIVTLTGAGISTRSGIPDFRSNVTGLWSHVNPMDVASLWGFHQHPQRFYDWLKPFARQIVQAQPNAAHRALAQLERMGRLQALITQNVDNLHQRAGSQHVIELHGHLKAMTCLECGRRYDSQPFFDAYLRESALPRCPHCGAPLKPDVILFGEPLADENIIAAQEAALFCDLMLVVGSSLEVMPAADLPALAKRSGSKLIIINLEKTSYDSLADVHIRGDAAAVLPRLVSDLAG